MAGKSNRSKTDDLHATPRRAVVDIGSNSVRLVIYDGPLRSPMAICNEKSLCGLGRDKTVEGGLNPDAVAHALATLKRFRMILTAYGDPPTYSIATAAVREASDGADFVKAVSKLGYSLNVISGEEEAELAALGVLLVEPEANGLVGDMGGGSLELVNISAKGLKGNVSLPTGPLSVMQTVGDDLEAARKHIKDIFDKTDIIRNQTYDALYTVGGAWRSIARIHMNLKQYPLSVLHHYEMSSATAIEVCDLVARQSRRSLEEIPGISRKRIDTLPVAAIALKLLLKAMQAKRMVVSSGGVREGLLYRELSDEARERDPLVDACTFLANQFAPEAGFGAAALRVITPLFQDAPHLSNRLLTSACELCDIAAYAHPDMRARHAFDTALSAPFVGVSHAERVWLALALYCRYRGRNSGLPNEQAISLLSWDEQLTATQVGLALRFIGTLAPKTPALLKGCRLKRTGEAIVFEAPAGLETLIGETPRKRLDALALSFELSSELKFAD
ncbi:MAG: Ppx/GppA family phosphatase [Pseudomonadota bacterium]